MATKIENCYTLSINNINQNFVSMEYSGRGPLDIRAEEIEKELQAGQKKPFKQIVRANIGDAQAIGQKPNTFLRQVMALVTHPFLLDSEYFSDDAKKRARDLLNSANNFFGSYTEICGLEFVRHQVANYIERRDDIKSDFNDIILIDGATGGIKKLLSLLNCEIDGKKPGIMIPVPQYPLFSATLAKYGMNQVHYMLDESNNWSITTEELERALKEGSKTSSIRAICIVNPGNPTGHVLKRKNIESIIKFAQKYKLFLFADEVHQDNVHHKDSKFFSFKKVMSEMGPPYNQLELASFMSISKGYLGECGIRGGYIELLNVCQDVRYMLLRTLSVIALCPTPAQVACSVLVNPPKEDEPSYKQFIKEKRHILSSLKEGAELTYKTFNSFEGFKCNPIQGAMYAFPQIKIPLKALEAAERANKPADTFYAFELLETSGICVVPGSQYGQQPGTYHFRMTKLPQVEEQKNMLNKFREFHEAFMYKYR